MKKKSDWLRKVGATATLPGAFIGLLNSITVRVELVAIIAFAIAIAGGGCLVAAVIALAWED